MDQLLSRPDEQRAREYKYRCAQSLVFGIPVVFLEYFGKQLGGPEAGRWVALFQALLAGWVMYVGAAGMLFEGLLRLQKKRISGDLVVALASAGLYLFSLVSAAGVIFAGRPVVGPPLFHVSVILIAAWTGFRWLRLSRHRSFVM